MTSPRSLLAMAAGIHTRSADEENQAAEDSLYRRLLEAAPDAMVVVDRRGNIVLLNRQAERLFGHDRNDLLGRPVTTLIPHGFAERLVADKQRSPEAAAAQQIGTGIELSGLRKDGSTFPIEIMLSPLEHFPAKWIPVCVEIMLSPLDASEGVMVTAIRDISARKAAEERLARRTQELTRSNEELAQFALIASHDLQAPLRAVSGFAQLLSRRYKGKFDADADAFIEFTVGGTARMQRLIDDLLAYARVGTDMIDRPIASSESALRRALANLHSAIDDSAAQVTHDPMPALPADETQLVQLFQNLIGNAIKHHGSGVPSIHVSAVRDAAGNWIFSVEDDGPGIQPQYFEQIFGVFQRLDTRQEFSGTGIGLAICRKIVERHGGKIWVESPPGKGATFRFALSGGDRKP
jgi:PAS domain S-box-containing protein